MPAYRVCRRLFDRCETEIKLVFKIQDEKFQPELHKGGRAKYWKVLLPGVILLAVAQLPLIALQMTNADLLALRIGMVRLFSAANYFWVHCFGCRRALARAPSVRLKGMCCRAAR
jgi:hypothetical protein